MGISLLEIVFPFEADLSVPGKCYLLRRSGISISHFQPIRQSNLERQGYQKSLIAGIVYG